MIGRAVYRVGVVVFHSDGERGVVIEDLGDDVIVKFDGCPHGVVYIQCNGRHQFAKGSPHLRPTFMVAADFMGETRP